MSESAESGETTDVDVLRSACSESRSVLDDQLRELSDIGDKALWTVRTSMLVLGVVVSAASLGDADSLRRLGPATTALGLGGVTLLLVASIYGLGTYFGADRVRGITPRHRQWVRRNEPSERIWRRTLLQGYDQWIADMESVTDRYGTHLFRAQTAFLLGVTLFVAAVVLSIWAP